MYFNPYTIPVLATVVLMLMLKHSIKKWRTTPGVRYMALFFLSVAWYSACYALEISATTIENALLITKFEYVGNGGIPAFFLLFAVSYTGKSRWLTKPVLAAVFLIPILTFFIVLTNESHFLFYVEPRLRPEGLFPVFEFKQGIWYIVYQSYILLSFTFSFLLFGRMWFQSAKIFRTQISYILVGAAAPFLGHLLYLEKWIPYGLEPSSFAFAASAVIIYFGLSRVKLFDLAPIARSLLFDTMPDGVIVLDRERRVVDANRAAMNYSGLSPQAFGEPALNALSGCPELCMFVETDFTKTNMEIERRIAGASIWLEVSSSPIIGHKETPHGQIIILHDITRRILAEKAIQQADAQKELALEAMKRSEEKYRNISKMLRLMCDNVPDLIWAKDMEKRFLFTNRAICSVLLNAEDTDEPVGKSDMFFALRERARHPERTDWHTFGEVCIDSDADVMNSMKPQRFDEYGNVQGKHIFLDVYKAPFIDEQGNMIGTVGCGRDMTAARRMEAELAHVSNLQRMLMNLGARFINLSSDKVDAEITRALAEIGAFTGVDRSFIFEYDAETDTLSHTYEWCSEGIPPEAEDLRALSAELMPGWATDLKQGKIVQVPRVAGLPENDRLRILLEARGVRSIIAIPLMSAAHCLGFVGFDSVRAERSWSESELALLKFFVDLLTNVKAKAGIERALIVAKEKAEESDRLKSAFLANMSHEIRTPMNGILGFAQLLKEPKLTGEDQQEYIRIIEQSSARMLNIINDIVDISKIESGQMEISIAESNINQQVEYIHTFFKPEVERKGMRLSYHNGLPAREALIMTDREKLYAILTNLVKNAIKYTDQGYVEMGYTKKDQVLEFYVRDTGIGVAKDRQEAIFDRFVQADISDTRAFQGAGLGLSITKAYVEMLGGRIWLESELGQGSAFYFTIPYATTTPEKRVVARAALDYREAGHVTHRRILIAEDEETSVLYLTTTLKKYHHTILQARNGIEAVDLCRSHPDLHLIFMDIKMPLMDGYEATRQIRSFNRDVIIIAQTAYGFADDKERALAAGCNDYVSKPVKSYDLIALINKHLKERR